MKNFGLLRYKRATVIVTALLMLFSKSPVNLGADATVASAQTAINAPKIEIEKMFKLEGGPSSVAWSPDSKLLVTGENLDRRVVIWDYAAQKALHRINRTYLGYWWVAFTPDGTQLIAPPVQPRGPANQIAFSVIDASSGTVVRDVEGPHENPGSIVRNMARHFAISSISQKAAIITADASDYYLSFYDTVNWTLRSTHKLQRWGTRGFVVADLAANPATGDIAVFGIGGGLELWDAATEQPIRRTEVFNTNGKAVAFSPEGKRLAASQGSHLTDAERRQQPDIIKLYDVETWQLVSSVRSPLDRNIGFFDLASSPDGKYFASISVDGKARLWDAQSFTLIAEINDGGVGGVTLAFSPDSKRLAIARNAEVRVVTIEDRN